MSPRDLGTELERLPGVMAATVFEDSHLGPQVYLTVEAGADLDAVRMRSRTLLRDHDLVIRPDQLHIGTAPRARLAPQPLPTLSLDGLEVHSANNRVECTVRLRAPNRTTTGSATEPDTPAGRARAAARATLAAAETLDPDLRMGLHGARHHDLFGFDVVVVLVEASTGRGHVQLPGVHVVDRSLEQATVLATLQALRSWTP